MDIILVNILILGAVGLISALILYFVSQKFAVEEDVKVEEINTVLPQANCGACGFAGCHDFATSCAKTNDENFSKFYCPVGGQKVMNQIAALMNFAKVEKEPTLAVLRCNGSCTNAPNKVEYEGVKICRIANRLATGRSGCPTGCLRLGDCVKVCKFGALSIHETTGLPTVDEAKCTSCQACVNICPRGLFEIRPKGQNGCRVYVACRNTQKGAVAKKNCTVACIGCMKCTKINPEVIVENNLSYIPNSVSAFEYGAALAQTCPTGAIICTNCPKEDNLDEK